MLLISTTIVCTCRPDARNGIANALFVSVSADKITTTPFVSPCIVAVGNEGNGLKEETISACKHKITIPMEGRAESLNAAVAASIIMWEMMK